MVKNIDVIKEFTDYKGKCVRSGSLFVEGDVLYSYGHHFPLCVRLEDCFIINSSSYSMTTSTHRNDCIREITGDWETNLKSILSNPDKYPNIKLMTCNEIKGLCAKYQNRLQDLTNSDLIKLNILKKL